MVACRKFDAWCREPATLQHKVAAAMGCRRRATTKALPHVGPPLTLLQGPFLRRLKGREQPRVSGVAEGAPGVVLAVELIDGVLDEGGIVHLEPDAQERDFFERLVVKIAAEVPSPSREDFGFTSDRRGRGIS